MLSSIRKDKNYRVVVKKFEIKRLQIKVFLQDISLKNQLRKTANLKRSFSLPTGTQTEKENSFNHTASSSSLLSQNLLSRLPRNSSKTRVKNRCIETGRSRSVLRFCKLSRIILREKASKGIIPGVSKASW